MDAPVALTLGDPAGIGGEIALAAWARAPAGIPMFLIGDRDHMHGLSRAAGIPVREIAAPVEAMAPGDGLPVLHHPLARPATPGLPDPGNAASVIAIIERGVDYRAQRRRLGALHQPGRQETAAGRRGLRPSRPHRIPRRPFPCPPAGDDAGLPRPEGGSGHHPPAPLRGSRGADARPPGGNPARHPCRPRHRLRRRGAAHRRRRAEPPRRREWRHGPRGDRGDRPGSRAPARRGHGPDRAPCGRHALPPGGAGALRRGRLHVPRPGADPGQVHRLRRQRQRDAGARLRAHIPGPRHRLRHRRNGPRRPLEPDRGTRHGPRPRRPAPRRLHAGR